jgi:uncharacterized protein (TIGR03435 family)
MPDRCQSSLARFTNRSPDNVASSAAERFKLAANRETKDLAVLALVVAKGGPKLKESEGEGESITTNAKKVGTGGRSVRTSMAQLADLFDGGLGRSRSWIRPV